MTMTTRRRTLLTAALCLGAIAILPTAGTVQAQTRSGKTGNVLKKRGHQHGRAVKRNENKRDYTILPRVRDRLEKLVVCEVVLEGDIQGNTQGSGRLSKRAVMIIHPHFIISPYFVIHPDYFVDPEFIIVPDYFVDPEFIIVPDYFVDPEFIIVPNYVTAPYGIIVPNFILADLYATAVMVGDVELVDDLEYLSRVMAVVGR
jgi:hypothetical protein